MKRSNPGPDPSPSQAAALRSVAAEFVGARREARAVAEYPGDVPRDLPSAYLCQDMAIDLWPDRVAGWKVGRIPPNLEKVLDSDRLAGPIFERAVHRVEAGESPDMPVFEGGFAAVEAEFIAIVNADAPDDKLEWSLEEALEMIRDLRLGMEIASSPLRTINELGPTVVVSDFGNNAGMIVGGPIDGWRERELESMTSETFVADRRVGRGGAHRLTGGFLRSVQFALQLAAKRGRPLRAGHVIATGQTTGIHDISPGQSARVVFAADGEARCNAVSAMPR